VPDASEHPAFAQRGRGFGGIRQPDDFERDVACERRIPRVIHASEAAAAELRDDPEFAPGTRVGADGRLGPPMSPGEV
jgi:hypothetical protein